MIDRNTKYAELFDAWQNESFRPYLLYWDKEDSFVKGKTLGEVYDSYCATIASANDHIASLEYVCEHRKDARFYSRGDAISPNAGYFMIPSENQKGTMVIFPRGYQSIHGLDEGISMARILSSYGYTCFVITYGNGDRGYFPRPIDDALTVLTRLTYEGLIKENEYMMIGFGIACHLIGMINREKYRRFYAKTRCLGMIYPIVTMGINTDMKERSYFLKDLSKEIIESTSVENGVDKLFPKTVFIRATGVNPIVKTNTNLMISALTEQGIPNETYKVDELVLNFGSGTGLSSQGYPHYLTDFYQGH